jgi:hypothetical protein
MMALRPLQTVLGGRYRTLLKMATAMSGNQIATPKPPTRRHHQEANLPLSCPFEARIAWRAFQPLRTAIAEPMPASHRNEKMTPLDSRRVTSV